MPDDEAARFRAEGEVLAEMGSAPMKNGELQLNRKQCLYVAGIAAGKSRRRAALDAGYSLSSANNPGHNIERGRVREAFAELRHFSACD